MQAFYSNYSSKVR